MPRSALAAPVETSVPGLPLRAAAMIYEAVLLFGVSFIAGYALLAALRWTHPLAAHQRWVLHDLLLGTRVLKEQSRST